MARNFSLFLIFVFFVNLCFAEDSKVKAKSFVFVDSPKNIKTVNLSNDGVFIEGKTITCGKDIEKIAKNFLGKEITEEVLESMKERIILLYREKNRPFVSVIYPEQDITTGNVYIIILEGRLGNITVRGIETKEKILKEIRTKPQEIIDIDKMIYDIDWMNKSDPLTSVHLIYEKGDKLGETDVTFEVNEKFPLKVFAGYEYSGYQVGGHDRFTTGFTMGRFFKTKQQLSVQVSFAKNPTQWSAVFGNYSIPLPSRDILKFYGNYVYSVPSPSDFQLQTLPENSSIIGKSYLIGGAYAIHFPHVGGCSNILSLGYEFRRTNNFFAYGVNTLNYKSVDTSEFVIRYNLEERDNIGFTFFGISLNISPGNMTAFNKTSIFELDRPGAKCNYIFGQVNMDRATLLWKNFEWILNFLGQYSSTKLLPVEEFSLGGYLTVRGYQENYIIGDNGVLIKNELKSPAFPFFKSQYGKMQLLAFFDFGLVSDIDQNILAKEFTTLYSVGPGLRYNFTEYVDLRIDFGIQLKRIPDRFGDKNLRYLTHAGAFIRF